MEKDEECCGNTDSCNMLISEGTQKSNLLNYFGHSVVTLKDTKFVNNLAIKAEPELEDFDIETVPLEIIKNNIEETKPETKLLLQLADHGQIKNMSRDNTYYCTAISQYDKYKITPCAETVQLARVKNDEAIDTPDPTFENFTIKNEELDLKEENLEVAETGYFSLSEPPPLIWLKKPKERCPTEYSYCKQENVGEIDEEEEDSKISSNVCQNTQDALRQRTEKNHQYETQASRIGSSKKLLLRHIIPEVKKFKCGQCEYQALQKGNLKQHLLKHMNPGEVDKLKCRHCEFETLHKSNLKQHLIKHMNPGEVNKFKCNQCEFQTRWKNSIKAHLIRHLSPEEVEQFKCGQCEHQTRRKDYLKRHLLMHMNSEEVKKFKCGRCKYETLRKGHLKVHLLRHMNPEEVEKFKCDHCEFQTFRKDVLKRHMLRHVNPVEVNTFKCSQCEFQTLRKDYLRRHMLTHVNPVEVNTFKCSQCKFQTVQKDYLKRHLRRHKKPEDVDKFKCS